MASSRTDAESHSDVAFALQELATCWNQAYEALTRGDVAAVTRLLDIADAQLATAGDGTADGKHEAELRKRAMATYGLLQHAMQQGLDGIRTELAKSRRGKRMLRGYDRGEEKVGARIARTI